MNHDNYLPEKFLFIAEEIALGREEIERMIGYEPGTAPEPFPGMIEEVLAKTMALLDFRGGLLVHKVDEFFPETCQIRLDNKVFSLHKIIYNQIKRAEQVALFQCTAGEGISEYARQETARGETIRAYIADVIGSVAVEAAMDRLQDSLETRMKDYDMQITNRYSPGYCNWDVSEQKLLFSFFPENYFGINLSETCLMHPIKSVSGIIGIGARVKKNHYRCGTCDMKGCIYKNR